MAALPRNTAAAIYRDDYWIKPSLDRIAAIALRIAAELLDTGVNLRATLYARELATATMRAFAAYLPGIADPHYTPIAPEN